MYPHHQRTIDRLVERFSTDPRFPALLVAGSIAHGWETENSDVDFLLIATPEEYEERLATHNLGYFAIDLCDYPGGYVDGKIISIGFIEEVADCGSEPARFAFQGAFPAYSQLDGLEELLLRASAYPEQGRINRIQSFHAQLIAWRWFMDEAEKKDDPYLKARAASELSLFGARMVLAHNHILYPFHKWMRKALQQAQHRPDDLLERLDACVLQPSPVSAESYYRCILDYREWETAPESWPARFLLDTEWAWRRDAAPIGDV
jgi:hypothetical protein